MVAKDAVLAGRYRLVERIGEGGMGSVWLARDEKAGTDVAIKVLHKTLVGDANAIERFHHEARAAARIEHENICRVTDVGEFESSPFLVMDLLTGESLAEKLTREGAVEPHHAARIMVDVLRGLAAAHEAGILHRDLKPENIFLCARAGGGEPVAKILDFGVSKFLGDDAARVKMTRTGALVGTPAYMSPEQALGAEDIDVRSDIWACGVLLFEMLSGRLVYEAANYNAMLVKIATEPPPALEDVVQGVDPVLARIARKALARDRVARLPTATAMADALQAWLDGAPVRIAARRISMPTPRVGMTPMSWAEEAPAAIDPGFVTLNGVPRPRVEPRVWALRAGVALALVLAATGVAVVRHAQRSHAATAETHAAAPAPAPGSRGTAPAPRVEPPAHEEHAVQVSNLPPDAVVTVNDAPVSLPARVAHGTPVRIVVTAPGYEPWSAGVGAATGDLRIDYGGRRQVGESAGALAATADAGATATTTGSSTSTSSGDPGAHPTGSASGASARPGHASRPRGGSNGTRAGDPPPGTGVIERPPF